MPQPITYHGDGHAVSATFFGYGEGMLTLTKFAAIGCLKRLGVSASYATRSGCAETYPFLPRIKTKTKSTMSRPYKGVATLAFFFFGEGGPSAVYHARYRVSMVCYW